MSVLLPAMAAVPVRRDRARPSAVNLATLNDAAGRSRSVQMRLMGELAQLHAALQAQYDLGEGARRPHSRVTASEPGLRSESTYLNIIGGLLTLLPGKSPAAKSPFIAR